MKSPLSELIDIDRRASEITRDSEERRLDISAIIQQKSDEQFESVMKAAQLESEKKTAEIISKAKNDASKITEETDQKLSRMKEYHKDHETKWIDEMYSRITGIKA